MEKEKIYQLFNEILNRLVLIYDKPFAKRNKFDKQIIISIKFLFWLPEWKIPTLENVDSDLNLISDSKTLADYENKLNEILTLAALSEKEDREFAIELWRNALRDKESLKHSASLKESEIDLIDQKLKAIWWVGTQEKDQSFKSQKWQRVFDETKKWEEFKIKKDKEKLMQIINELKFHCDRIYSKFSRNRNERDNEVVTKIATIISLPVWQKPASSDFEYFVSLLTSDVQIKQLEEKFSGILKNAIQSEEIDNSLNEVNIWAKDAIKKIKKYKKTSETNKTWRPRVNINDKIERYKVLKQRKLDWHLATLNELDVKKLESQIKSLNLKKSKKNKKLSRWERIRSEEKKKLWKIVSNKKKNNNDSKHLEIKKWEEWHPFTLNDWDLKKLNEKLWSGSGKKRVLPFKWERIEKKADFNIKSWIKFSNITWSGRRALSEDEVDSFEESLWSKFWNESLSKKRKRHFLLKWERAKEERKRRRKSSWNWVIKRDKSREFLKEEDIDNIRNITK